MKLRLLSGLLAALFLLSACQVSRRPPSIRIPSTQAPSRQKAGSRRESPVSQPPEELPSFPTTSTEDSSLPEPSSLPDSSAPAPVSPASGEAASGGSYGRRSLPAALRVGYDRLEAAVLSGTEQVSLPRLDGDSLSRILTYLRRDHPEISWLGDKFSYSEQAHENKTTVWLTFIRTAEDIAALCRELDRAAADFLQNIDPSLPDFDKAVLVFDRLCERVRYDLSSPRQGELAGALLDGRAGCGGYARAYQYLLNRLGVETLIVYGQASEAHAWNIVRVEGDYYCADPTWGDAELDDGTELLSHEWLLLDDEHFSRTHTPLMDGTNYPLPACTATAQNYFVKTGTFVESFDRRGLSAALDAAFGLAAANGYPAAQIAFPPETPPSALLGDGTLDSLAQEAAARKGMRLYGRSSDQTGLLISYLISPAEGA